jgi:hypothetical protein
MFCYINRSPLIPSATPIAVSVVVEEFGAVLAGSLECEE